MSFFPDSNIFSLFSNLMPVLKVLKGITLVFHRHKIARGKSVNALAAYTNYRHWQMQNVTDLSPIWWYSSQFKPWDWPKDQSQDRKLKHKPLGKKDRWDTPQLAHYMEDTFIVSLTVHHKDMQGSQNRHNYILHPPHHRLGKMNQSISKTQLEICGLNFWPNLIPIYPQLTASTAIKNTEFCLKACFSDIYVHFPIYAYFLKTNLVVTL